MGKPVYTNLTASDPLYTELAWKSVPEVNGRYYTGENYLVPVKVLDARTSNEVLGLQVAFVESTCSRRVAEVTKDKCPVNRDGYRSVWDVIVKKIAYFNEPKFNYRFSASPITGADFSKDFEAIFKTL
uniref:COesterase domain-containing protein n=1 Tax=Caenorhabditis tropicalis TaxID=1561998 RepID=A0A1I7UUW9_9PELO